MDSSCAVAEAVALRSSARATSPTGLLLHSVQRVVAEADIIM